MLPRPITIEEAYEQLNGALNAVRKRHPDNFFSGPNFPASALATARNVIEQLQMALLIKMDGVDISKLEVGKGREVIIRLKPEEAEALSQFMTDARPEPTSDEAALSIILGQLKKLGYLE